MNVFNIQNLCNYLEEIGIIEQKSVSLFLTLYSYVINPNNINNNNKTDNNSYIFENVLCAYLKKIFNVEKNFQIFSNKLINKFKQNYLIKQYNGLILFFVIFRKIFNSFKIQAFYKIKEKSFLNLQTKTIKNKFIKENRNEQEIEKNNTYNIYNDNKNAFSKSIGTPNRIKNPVIYNYNNKSTAVNFFKDSKINERKPRNLKYKLQMEEKSPKILNKSVDYIKISMNNKRQKSDRNNSLNFTNDIINRKKSLINGDVQLEFKKKKFLSKIKKEHSINFKKIPISSSSFTKNKLIKKDFLMNIEKVNVDMMENGNIKQTNYTNYENNIKNEEKEDIDNNPYPYPYTYNNNECNFKSLNTKTNIQIVESDEKNEEENGEKNNIDYFSHVNFTTEQNLSNGMVPFCFSDKNIFEMNNTNNSNNNKRNINFINSNNFDNNYLGPQIKNSRRLGYIVKKDKSTNDKKMKLNNQKLFTLQEIQNIQKKLDILTLNSNEISIDKNNYK